MSGIFTTRKELQGFVANLAQVPRERFPEQLARFIASCDAPVQEERGPADAADAPAAVETAEEIVQVSDAETEPEAWGGISQGPGPEA